MKKACKKAVVIVDDGVVQEILVNFQETIDIRIVDFDRKTLDQSAIKLLTGPFHDIAALADVFPWYGEYNPERVKEVFDAVRELHGIRHVTLNEKDV